MKRILLILTAITLLISSTACTNGSKPAETSSNTSQSSETSTKNDNPEKTDPTSVPETTPAEKKPTAGGSDYTSLKLINYFTDDGDGTEPKFFANTEDWQKLDDYELFREYFFGKWEISKDGPYMAYLDRTDSIYIDDSKYSLSNYGMLPFGGFYRVSDNVLGFFIGMQSGSHFYWIDTDQPDKMYVEYGGFDVKNNRMYLYSPSEGAEGYKTRYFQKTSNSPTSSENDNYVSIYKFHEISKAYGIDMDMLLKIKFVYTAGEKEHWLSHDDGYSFYPVYLVSESDDKLEFETTVGNRLNGSEILIPVTYTIEKKSGEWVRTAEVKNLDLIETEYDG